MEVSGQLWAAAACAGGCGNLHCLCSWSVAMQILSCVQAYVIATFMCIIYILNVFLSWSVIIMSIQILYQL